MKIVLLSDLHAGVKSGNLNIASHQLDYLDKMLDYMKKNKIDTIFQLGDSLDNRKQTNHTVLDLWCERFYDKMHSMKIKYHTLIGNHDCPHKNTLDSSGPTLLFSKYKNVTIYDKPQDISFDGLSFLVLPWICLDNYAESLEKIQTSKSMFVLGHLELANFEMYKGQVCNEGMDRSLFRKFDSVFSGHFHTKSSGDNIHYLGCPYELTWADYNDPRGFHVFDTQTHDLTFVKNDDPIFVKYEYDDTQKGDDYWKSFDATNLKGKFLKLIVVNKTDAYQFDRLVDALYNAELEDFKIIEDFSDMSASDIDDDDLEMEDSMTLVDTYIDAVEYSGDKVKLKSIMKSLYVESLLELT